MFNNKDKNNKEMFDFIFANKDEYIKFYQKNEQDNLHNSNNYTNRFNMNNSYSTRTSSSYINTNNIHVCTVQAHTSQQSRGCGVSIGPNIGFFK